MNADHLLGRCEEIANISAWMLAAARDGNWKEVDSLKTRAGIAINEVRELSSVVTLSADERKRKLASIQQILANDGQIQELSQPWLKRVARWLPAGGVAPGHFEKILR